MAKNAPEIEDYKYGFHDEDVSIFRSDRGLTPEIVKEISNMKEEPQWMLDFRLKSLQHFYDRPMPMWGGDLSEDRKSTRLNSSHVAISYAVFCLKKKIKA